MSNIKVHILPKQQSKLKVIAENKWRRKLTVPTLNCVNYYLCECKVKQNSVTILSHDLQYNVVMLWYDVGFVVNCFCYCSFHSSFLQTHKVGNMRTTFQGDTFYWSS